MTFSTDTDVRNQLGAVASRLPTWVDLEANRAIANADVLDRLSRVYPNGIPAFTGPGADVVKFAEARLAAAETLEQIRVSLPDLGDTPDRLRTAAYDSLADGVVGYPPGSETIPDDPETGSTATTTPGPRVSSFTPLSVFPDPYAASYEYPSRRYF